MYNVPALPLQIGYIHKFTDRTEYNSLEDPLLKSHFTTKKGTLKTLVASQVMTPDNYVLRSKKYAHQNRYTASLTAVAAKERAALETNRKIAKKRNKASFKELCQAKVQNWQDVQRVEAEGIAQMKANVEAKKPPAEETPLSEQGRLYVEEKKEQFLITKDDTELRSIELDAERQIKQAKKEKWLAQQAAEKTASLLENEENKAIEFAGVKANIENTKAMAVATKQRNIEDEKARQEKCRKEAEEFAMHLEHVLTERAEKQEADIKERKRIAKEDQEERDRKREEARLEKVAFDLAEKEREAAERAAKLAILEAEEAERKREQMLEKENRAAAKRAFEESQRELARLNKEQAQQERHLALEAETLRQEEFERKREERLQANAAEKTRRVQAKADAAEEHRQKQAAEAAAAAAYMEQELAAQEAEFKKEQRTLFEQELMEQKAEADREQAERRSQKRAELQQQQRDDEEAARQEKAAEDLVKEKAARKAATAANLARQKAEVERRIEYMKKFG